MIIPPIILDQMREVERRLRFLASCDAEQLPDWERVNLLVKAGLEAAELLGRVRKGQ
jgi:hypothetical protein